MSEINNNDSNSNSREFKIIEGGATIDKPIHGLIKNNDFSRVEELDTLKTFDYAKALAEHVKVCGTPLTVGVQGEWGSGKTSLLNMMKEQIEEVDAKTGVKGAQAVLGKKIYKTIWINTWEHSLLKSPEECLLSIINEIIDTIAAVDGTWNSAQKAKSALSALAKGAVRIGATAALGAKAGQVADEVLGQGTHDGNSVKILRLTLENTIETIVDRNDQSIKRFIIFIDDLDRLDPPTAVMVLELLKNIFDLPHCVFVVAIDYQVVVKGLKDKFGEPSEKNEWEFRAFFDKIIQLPFMMPMNRYRLDEYLQNLLEGVKYFSKSEIKELGFFQPLTRMTIGYNPRSLKRLVNSLSLIFKYYQATNEKVSKEDYFQIKQLVLAFVCIQISFPRIFELLRARPTFYEWDDEFVNKVTGGQHTENRNLADMLNRAMEINSEDFDAEWEQALFKIVWVKEWQRDKLVQASRVLSIIEENILHRASGKAEDQSEDRQEQTDTDDLKDKADKKLLVEALELTAVTSVASTEETALSVSSRADESNDGANAGRLAYWQNFRVKVRGAPTKLEWNAVRGTHTSSTFWRKSIDLCDMRVQLFTSCNSTAAIGIETIGDPAEDFLWFDWLKNNSSEYFKKIGTKAHFKVKSDATKQSVKFSPPSEIIPPRKDLSSKGLEGKRSNYLDWIIETLPLLETSIIAAFEDFNSVGVMESSSPPGASGVASQPDERSQAENQPLGRPSV